MDIKAFLDSVDEHPTLEGADISDEGFTVHHIPTGKATRIPVEKVQELDWITLEDIMTLKREPKALHGFTRVVGYYSRPDNWNPSKIGELKDRQKGNYGIETPAHTHR